MRHLCGSECLFTWAAVLPVRVNTVFLQARAGKCHRVNAPTYRHTDTLVHPLRRQEATSNRGSEIKSGVPGRPADDSDRRWLTLPAPPPHHPGHLLLAASRFLTTRQHTAPPQHHSASLSLLAISSTPQHPFSGQSPTHRQAPLSTLLPLLLLLPVMPCFAS